MLNVRRDPILFHSTPIFPDPPRINFVSFRELAFERPDGLLKCWMFVQIVGTITC